MTEPPAAPMSRGARPIAHLVAAIALAAAATAFAYFASLNWSRYPAQLRYAVGGARMPATPDAFFFLSGARTALETGSLAGVPFFSAMTAAVARALPFTLDEIAYWFPLLFVFGIACLHAAWGVALRLEWRETGLAALAGTLVPAWLYRVGPGMFDTDCAIAFFWQATLLPLSLLCVPGRIEGKKRVAAWLACAFALAMLCLTWSPWPGWLLTLLPLCLWTLFGLEPRRRRRALLAGLAVAAAAAAVAGLTEPGRRIAASYAGIFRVVFRMGDGDLIAESVGELAGLNPHEFLLGIGGTGWGGAAALVAAACLWRVRLARPALASACLFMVMGYFSWRFLYLAAFPLGLAVGTLPRNLAALAARFRGAGPSAGRRVGLALLSAALCASVLGGMFWWSGQRRYVSSIVRGHDRLAQALRRAAPPGAAAWCWWDDGYFVDYRAGLPVFADGGRQFGPRTFAVARSLLMGNPRTAGRWIRFLALRGLEGLEPLAKAYGEDAAWPRLEEILSAPDPGASPAALAVDWPEAAGAWLVPEGRVFLFLTRRILSLTAWLSAFGASPTPDPAHLRPHILPFLKKDFAYDPATSGLTLPPSLKTLGLGTRIEAVIDADAGAIGPPWPSRPPPYLVVSAESPWQYAVSDVGLRSLVFRLFVSEVAGFKPVAIDRVHGGVWEVER